VSREWRLYLDDIERACAKVRRFTDGLARQAFFEDERTCDAVLHNLEIIGEAAKHLPDQVRQEIPDVEWRKVAGFRDWLAHAYFGIDPDILWDVIQNKLGPLENAIRTWKEAHPQN
jgi:uncharacterized protein with HEPN domain